MRMRVLKLATPFVQTQTPNFKSEYEFVEKPSEEYFCPVTFELLIDPVQTNFCCGNHLSRAVAEQLQAEGKPCPKCKKSPLKTTDDRFFKRKVMELKVYCKNKSAGCQWQWELGELDSHLNLGSLEGQCDFIEVECTLKFCKGVMLRSTNPTIVPSDRFLAITNRHTKRLSMIIGRNASVFPKFAPTNVLPIRLSVDFFNTISKSNVLCKKFRASIPLLVARQQWRGKQCKSTWMRIKMSI